MTEGWCGDDYLILFEDESRHFEQAYGLAESLPGFRLVGLRGWDDFLLEDPGGGYLTVPTVPVLERLLKRFSMPVHPAELVPDARFAGRIKWYTKPIAFGGDPNPGENLTWVGLRDHTQLVRWWNAQYQAAPRRGRGTPAA